jgi:NADPH:quinone reductase-like Zn-dependent oxidoreductase
VWRQGHRDRPTCLAGRGGTGGRAHHLVAGDDPVDVAEQVRKAAPAEGVDRVADLAFGPNIERYLVVVRYGGMIASYATGAESTPSVPYWPMGFKNLTMHFLSNDDFPESANATAARELTEAVRAGDLRYPIAGASRWSRSRTRTNSRPVRAQMVASSSIFRSL